jgi:hypothetical protein
VAEDTPERDQLSVNQLGMLWGFSKEFLKAHPAIRKVFEDAIANDWMESEIGRKKFEQALYATPWWRNNSSYARDYFIAHDEAYTGGEPTAEWQDQVAEAGSEVQAVAVSMGVTLTPEALDFFTEQYMMNGWKERPQFLRQALTGNLEGFTTDFIDYDKGPAASLEMNLRSIARANGISYDESYYTGAARAVLAGLATPEDYIAEIRETAASRFPIFSERIRAGENARDIASPYITRMSEILELDGNEIDLNDRWITKALGNVGADGKPSAMSLWDFEKSLRSDERWQYTKNAHDEVSSLTSEIVSMFGFGG